MRFGQIHVLLVPSVHARCYLFTTAASSLFLRVHIAHTCTHTSLHTGLVVARSNGVERAICSPVVGDLVRQKETRHARNIPRRYNFPEHAFHPWHSARALPLLIKKCHPEFLHYRRAAGKALPRRRSRRSIGAISPPSNFVEILPRAHQLDPENEPGGCNRWKLARRRFVYSRERAEPSSERIEIAIMRNDGRRYETQSAAYESRDFPARGNAPVSDGPLADEEYVCVCVSL